MAQKGGIKPPLGGNFGVSLDASFDLSIFIKGMKSKFHIR